VIALRTLYSGVRQPTDRASGAPFTAQAFRASEPRTSKAEVRATFHGTGTRPSPRCASPTAKRCGLRRLVLPERQADTKPPVLICDSDEEVFVSDVVTKLQAQAHPVENPVVDAAAKVEEVFG